MLIITTVGRSCKSNSASVQCVSYHATSHVLISRQLARTCDALAPARLTADQQELKPALPQLLGAVPRLTLASRTHTLCLSAMQTPLRDYQERAAKQALQGSTIAVLPTGSGKTLIGAVVAAATAAAAAHSRASVLFIVPTRLLVEQQAHALSAETDLAVAQYMADLKVPDPKAFDVLVALPQAYIALKNRDERFGFGQYSLIIFDEVHHVIKRHPYRTIARQLQKLPAAQRPRVLGLTASLTYAVGAGAIERLQCLRCTRCACSKRATCGTGDDTASDQAPLYCHVLHKAISQNLVGSDV